MELTIKVLLFIAKWGVEFNYMINVVKDKNRNIEIYIIMF